MEFKILNRAKKQRVLERLGSYSIEKINYLLLQLGSRLRIFSGKISKNELLDLFRGVRVDNIGLYFAAYEKENFLRLNLDAVHLFASQIKQQVLEIPDEQAEGWFRGQEIILNENERKNIEGQGIKEGFIILKNREDFIGIGKLCKTRILNYLPKERRIKN